MWHRLVALNELIDPSTRSGQFRQRRGAFQNYLTTRAAGNEGCVAHELNRITQSLLGLQKQGAAVERCPIPPAKWAGRLLSGLESPFVFRPTALKVSRRQPD